MADLLRLIQLDDGSTRRVGVVEGDRIRLLADDPTVHDLVIGTVRSPWPLARRVAKQLSDEVLDYDPVYAGQSPWRILPPIDYPREPARCLVSGTGLTHLRSASNRQAMHTGAAEITDSMRMYDWGVAGGRPAEGEIGAAPEWFYKGNGFILRAHNQALQIPAHAEDGGDEAEIAGVYVIDGEGVPRRVGFTIGNEFSDHVVERRNYLYLAASKLRTCAIGPELILGGSFDSVTGRVTVSRNGGTLWTKPLRTGESAMCHSLANLEHHHFKFDEHRRPGDVHVHFFGADAFSFGEGIRLQHGDTIEVAFEGFGRPLRNTVSVYSEPRGPFVVDPI